MPNTVRLTSLASCAGCAAKVRPEDLEQVLLQLIPNRDPRILGKGNHYDDAVVIQVNDSTTLVQTVDFFTPIVDDPYWYGRIAAANALSDVYAMGGRPITAMNIVCFPTRSLGPQLLAEILRGGQEALALAGAALAGGHTIEDAEPKFGLAVTGLVDPNKVTFKGGLEAGDQLYLTKPIGTGVITTAHKRDLIEGDDLHTAIEWMAQLNDQPSLLMSELGCRGATDVTGYSLLGHAMEMARAGEVCLELEASAVPLLPRVRELRARGAFPGGSAANRAWLEKSGQLHFEPEVADDLRDLFCDAQTSGGLLLGLKPGNDFEQRMRAAGRSAWRIGSVHGGKAGIRVVAGP
ncbi:MAG: selenide, water dikinase SelD [Candidatus Eremiobacteraeota bacterium]|nr:selenide, water dikinase SelD [Candidatus Eremiobacteraeota bacterium]MCW5870261.1 selenide, water dikinase SelD [Candidatus Eremiobacteraeota bacterium]